MKKIITTLLLISIGMPSVSFAAAPMTISQYPLDVLILQQITLRLSGGTNLAQSMITWRVGEDEAQTGKGLTSYSMRLGPKTEVIEVEADVVGPDGVTSNVGYTISPRGLGTQPLSRFRAIKATSTSPDIFMRINPPGPKGFDKVTVDLTTSKNLISAYFADNEVKVDWYLYGSASSSYTGTKYTFRLGPSTTPVPIKAVITRNGAVEHTLEAVLKPFDDGLINPADNLSRALSCTADSLDLVANNIDLLNKMVNDTMKQLDALAAEASTSVSILTNSVEGIQRDFTADVTSASTLATKPPSIKDWADVSGAFRWLANIARLILKLKDGGSTMKRILRIQKAMSFLANLPATITKLKNQKANQLKSMQSQFDRQMQTCSKAYKKVNTHGV